jgi:hypothetical protein
MNQHTASKALSPTYDTRHHTSIHITRSTHINVSLKHLPMLHITYDLTTWRVLTTYKHFCFQKNIIE